MELEVLPEQGLASEQIEFLLGKSSDVIKGILSEQDLLASME